LAKHVRDACDGLDGIVDGVVSNPAACTPAVANVAALRCVGGADTGDTYLPDAQLAVVTSWTTDAVFAGSATFRNAGWSLTGNEDDPGAWAPWVTGNGNVTTALQFLFQDTTVKNYLARDPAADSLTYTPWDQNQNALYAMAALNDATNPDIRPTVRIVDTGQASFRICGVAQAAGGYPAGTGPALRIRNPAGGLARPSAGSAQKA